jgi:zinc protease
VEKVEREDLIKRWQQVLKGKNIVVAVVGDMPLEELEKRFRAVFSKLPLWRVQP